MALENSAAAAADASTQDRSGFAGIVEVDELSITNHAGETVDVRGMYVEFNVETSLFEPGIRGALTLYDAQGLLTRLPIVGEETLRVSYKTPGNEPKTGEFFVWKVTDEQPDEKGLASSYVLHFCCPEMLRNAKTIVARSYDSTGDVSGIVKSLLYEYLQSSKQFYARSLIRDPAVRKLVVPMYRPLEAVDMVLRRGYSGLPGRSDYYLFFERFDGWYLISIDDLVANPINKRLNPTRGPDDDYSAYVDKPETWYVYASDKYQEDSVSGRDIRRIVSMSVNSRFDSLEKVRQGAYDGETVQYSIVDKEVTSKTFRHLRDGSLYLGGGSDPYQKLATAVEKHRTNTPQFIAQNSYPETGYAGTQAPKVFYRLKDPEEGDLLKKAGGLYQATRVLLSQVQVTLTVPGDTMVDVGDVVHVAVPRFDSIEDQGQPDKFTYGKYVVGTIRDSVLAPDKHAMSVDLYRDSYATEIEGSELHKDL